MEERERRQIEERERRLAEERAQQQALRLQRKQRLDALVRKRKANLLYLKVRKSPATVELLAVYIAC